MLELSDKDIKAAIISMLQWTITNANKTKIETLSKQIYSLGKEIFLIKFQNEEIQ